MVKLRQGRIMTLLCVLFISCSAVDESDDNTSHKPCTGNLSCEELWIIIGVLAGIYFVSLVGVMIYRIRRYLRRETYDRSQRHKPTGSTDDSLMKGRISNVELWKLVQYSAKNKENDKLSEAILQLTRDIPTSGYGSVNSDYDRMETGNLRYFQRLCHWKDTCAPTEEIDKLFEACSQAKMEKTVKKLKDFRNAVSERVSDCDLEHILWQIGKKSSENITTLLRRLTNSPFNQEPSLSENVRCALPELQKWTKGYHDINPAVTLSLQSDDLCSDDMYFFIVSEKDKRPLEDAEIRLLGRNVSKVHCKQIISIISTKGKSKRKKEEKVVNTILDENEMDLFDTYQMIKEWLGEQECSNYEKRNTLQTAVKDAKEASTSNEINLHQIEQLATSKGNAEAAYDLLMKDIKTFATILGLDECKLTEYRQLSSSSKSTRGTIGLVADVRAIKGRTIF